MPWKCPVCGHINPDDKEFCEVCGAKKPENPEIVEASEPEAVKLQEPRPTEQPSEKQGEEKTEEAETEKPGETGGAEAREAGEAEAAAEESEAVEETEKAEEEAREEAKEAKQPSEEREEAKEAKLLEKPPETIYLEVVNSPAAELIGKKIPVLLKVFPRVTIGRSPENVIILPDPTVSRKHAVIKVEDGKLVLEDLGSTNGTYVYRQETGSFEKVEKIELEPGMVIRFGEQTIVRVTTEPA